MGMIDLRAPVAVPECDPVVMVASCRWCGFDGEVTATVLGVERGWSACTVTYGFTCPNGCVNEIRDDGGGGR